MYTPPMLSAMSKHPLVFALLPLLLLGCSSQPTTLGGPVATTASGDDARDSGAMTDLAASPKWSQPSCRWLKHGAYVLAYPQETALYRAAYEVGYIDMQETGTTNRTGTPEPTWRIALTEQGKVVAAECPPSTKPEVWGVPVSRRQLIAGKFVAQAQGHGQRTTYEVDYTWVPTEVGEKVRHELTGTMQVQEGRYRTKVYLKRGPDFTVNVGPNGWYVDAVDELGAERVP